VSPGLADLGRAVGDLIQAKTVKRLRMKTI